MQISAKGFRETPKKVVLRGAIIGLVSTFFWIAFWIGLAELVKFVGM